MGSVSTIYNGVRQRLAGRALMDVAFSSTSTNGVQNKVIKAKFDEVEAEISAISPKTMASVTADGTASYSNLLNQLYSQLDVSFSNFRKLELSMAISGTFMIFTPSDYNGSRLRFSKLIVNSTSSELGTVEVQATSSHFYALNSGTGTVTDLSSTVPASGSIISITMNT